MPKAKFIGTIGNVDVKEGIIDVDLVTGVGGNAKIRCQPSLIQAILDRGKLITLADLKGQKLKLVIYTKKLG